MNSLRKPSEVTIKGKTLAEILENHKHFLDKDCDNWESMQADLSHADLSYTELCGVDLSHADLSYTELCDVDLLCVNLSYANLQCTNLSNSNLSKSNLSHANLSRADLCNTDLQCVDLCNADLQCANLRDSDLRNANLHHAYLSYSNLNDTLLDDSEKIRQGMILSESMIGWKKCSNDVIVKLEIPKDSIVFSINNDECRTNKAKCIDIIGGTIAESMYDSEFVYEIGKEYNVSNFNLQYNIEWGSGIHFFRTREEAEQYKM